MNVLACPYCDAICFFPDCFVGTCSPCPSCGRDVEVPTQTADQALHILEQLRRSGRSLTDPGGSGQETKSDVD